MKLDKNLCKMYMCDFSDISHILRDFHYKSNAIGGGISNCFCMVYNGELVGGSVLGLPRHSKKYPNAIDVRRMACIDDTPKNAESWFLGSIIKWISRDKDYDFILSYSDLTKGHEGTIYKASNFTFNGLTAPSKEVHWLGKIYHPRSITIDRDYSYKMREAIESGEAKIVTGKPKKIWIYNVKKKQKYKHYNITKYTGNPNQINLFQ